MLGYFALRIVTTFGAAGLGAAVMSSWLRSLITSVGLIPPGRYSRMRLVDAAPNSPCRKRAGDTDSPKLTL